MLWHHLHLLVLWNLAFFQYHSSSGITRIHATNWWKKKQATVTVGHLFKNRKLSKKKLLNGRKNFERRQKLNTLGTAGSASPLPVRLNILERWSTFQILKGNLFVLRKNQWKASHKLMVTKKFSHFRRKNHKSNNWSSEKLWFFNSKRGITTFISYFWLVMRKNLVRRTLWCLQILFV